MPSYESIVRSALTANSGMGENYPSYAINFSYDNGSIFPRMYSWGNNLGPMKVTLDNGEEKVIILVVSELTNYLEPNDRDYFCMCLVIPAESPTTNTWTYLEGHTSIHAVYEYILSAIKQVYPTAIRFSKISDKDFIMYLLDNFTSFHTNPIYSDATKINYTDGSYEVIRDRVLTESEVKIHAYKNLLNSYGNFYRATEKEINTLDKR